MAESQIEWTDATWNPVAGCSLASAGCKNCYAMHMARRLEAMGVDKYKGLTQKRGRRVTWNAHRDPETEIAETEIGVRDRGHPLGK